MEKLLIFPMAFYVFYIGYLAVLNFRIRKNAVQTRQITGEYFKAYQGSVPERVIIVGRHYDNQFQTPMLFLVTCVAFIALKQTSMLTLVLAWAFVITRLGHSYEHLGRNRLIPRVLWFVGGWITVLALWIQLCCLAICQQN